MLGLSDFLNLQGENAATRILKPWWDILADCIIRILILISIVTGVVSIYVKDIACVPAVECPGMAVAYNSSQNSLFKQICATFYNSNHYLEKNILDSFTVFTKFPDRNLNLYVNSECMRLEVTWFSKFFPFVLFWQAGACLVVHNIWLTLGASITEQFSTLVNECYDSSDRIPEKSEAKERNVGELQEVAAEFVHDVQLEVIGEPWKTTNLQRKVTRFAKELRSKSFSKLRIRYVYAAELIFQFVFLAIFLVLDFTLERNEGSFACNMDLFADGFVQDHFICSYSHPSFYRWSLYGFVTGLSLYLIVNVRRVVWFLQEGRGCFIIKEDLKVQAGDFAFLLTLLRISYPIFLVPINDILASSYVSELPIVI